MTAPSFLAPLAGQLVVGLINGSFYAMLSLGLAIIFGLLNLVNFAHGAQYMLGALVAWMLLQYLDLGYWPALIAVPVLTGVFGLFVERILLLRVYKLDHQYGFLLTFGLAMAIQGLFSQIYGTSGLNYPAPALLSGGFRLGFVFLPTYRIWVIAASLAICLATWAVIEFSRLGAYLRAAIENPSIVQAFGINVPLLVSLTYGAGVALAGLAGLLAAPIYQVNPLMGSNLVIVVFAVVVIGGMGSLGGAIVTGFGLGIVEGVTKYIYPEASDVIVFVVMTFVLILRPSGLFGRGGGSIAASASSPADTSSARPEAGFGRAYIGLVGAAMLLAPFVFYPLFLSQLAYLALFACAFSFLAGQSRLLSFGHAAFFGTGAYFSAWLAVEWNGRPELCLLAAVAGATVLGAAFAWLAIRRQGIYFAMVTLALAQIVYFVALRSSFTHGEDGIQGVPRGWLFGVVDLSQPITMYYVALALAVATFFALRATIRSPIGAALRAISQNEARAISLGYDADRIKLLGFVISAAFSGLAGGLKTVVAQFVTLGDVHFTTSGDVLLMTLIGGVASLEGAILGAIAMGTLNQYIGSAGAWVPVIEGCAFVACVLAFRNGIYGGLQAAWERASRGLERPRSKPKRATAPDRAS